MVSLEGVASETSTCTIAVNWSNHKNAHSMQLCNAQRYHVCQAGQLAHDMHSQATKLSSSFMLNSDESVVLQKLSLNVHTLRLKKNSLLFLLSIESSLGRQRW